MDINICIERLGLNGNRYRLNQSNPPHHFIEWNGSEPQPTEAELQAAWNEHIAEHAATQYQRDRAAEYPSIEECVHAILDGELDALQAVRAEIKARYPKP